MDPDSIDPEQGVAPVSDADDTVERAALQEGLAAEVRAATFSTVMRGYDKEEVDGFLASLAERLEGAGDDAWSSGALKRELERVGETTKDILSAAEEAARKLREDAGDEARRLRLEASRKAEETISAAQAKAEDLAQAAVSRHRVLEARIERLMERRDRVVNHLARLSDQLSAMASAAQDEEGRPLEAHEEEPAVEREEAVEPEEEPATEAGAEVFDAEAELDAEPATDAGSEGPDATREGSAP